MCLRIRNSPLPAKSHQANIIGIDLVIMEMAGMKMASIKSLIIVGREI